MGLEGVVKSIEDVDELVEVEEDLGTQHGVSPVESKVGALTPTNTHSRNFR